MALLDAIDRGTSKDLQLAVAAGERVGPAEFEACLKADFSVLKLLVELQAVPLDAKDNVLHRLGRALAKAYPNAARLKRAKQPNTSEPLVISALRAKAALLIDAGAIVDFEAAVRLGLIAQVEAMLLVDPALGKQPIDGVSPSELAAQGGAWDVSRLLKTSKKAGFVFDWAGAQKAVLDWASAALVAFARAHAGDNFRRVALEFDAQGTLRLSADSTDGNAHFPEQYSHRRFADFAGSPEGAALLAQSTQPDRFLVMLGKVALELEAGPSVKALKRGMRFTVLAFNHDEEEPAALLRQKIARRG